MFRDNMQDIFSAIIRFSHIFYFVQMNNQPGCYIPASLSKM